MDGIVTATPEVAAPVVEQPRNDAGQFSAPFDAEKIMSSVAEQHTPPAAPATAAAAPAAAAPAAAPAAEPVVVATPAAPAAAPTFAPDLLTRAEAAGMTQYEAIELGTPAALEAELAKRTPAPTPAASAAPQSPAPAAAPTPAPAPGPAATPAPGSLDAIFEQMKSLPDLSANDYDAEQIQRDKLYRGVLQQLHDGYRQLQEQNKELGGVHEFVQQTRQQQEIQAIQAAEKVVDDYVSSLGDEFLPIFGKGRVNELGQNSPYLRVRDTLFQTASALRKQLPNLSANELLDRAAQVLYPKPFELRAQRQRSEAIRTQANGVAFASPSGPIPTPPPKVTLPEQDPEFLAEVARIDRENAGL